MSLVKFVATSIVVVGANFAVAADVDQVALAQSQVDDYRALRHACAVTRGEQRRVCFSQLNNATEGYKQAKKLLSIAKLESQKQLIGQAQ